MMRLGATLDRRRTISPLVLTLPQPAPGIRMSIRSEGRPQIASDAFSWTNPWALAVFPDLPEVGVAELPRLKVSLEEVGQNRSEIIGVGGPSSALSDWRIQPW
jgi:hypothetical protein